jgi:hypothetical protein
LTAHADEQLAAVDRIHELLEGAGIEYWLFGGWAVDFHAGSVTRAHVDVDVAVWAHDLDRIRQLLEADGGGTRPRKARTATPAMSAAESGSSWRFSRELKMGRCTHRCATVVAPGRAARSSATLPSCAGCAQGSSASERSERTSRRFATTRS